MHHEVSGGLPITDHQITDEDVNRVLEAARTITLPPEREIIHIIRSLLGKP